MSTPVFPVQIFGEDPDGLIIPVAVNKAGAIDVTLQDQTTPSFFMKFIHDVQPFTLASDCVIDSYTFEVVTPHTIEIGRIIEFYNQFRWLQAVVLDVSGSTITIDQPLDYEYHVATTTCYHGDENFNVDGSGTVVVGRVTNKDLVLSWDITQLDIVITAIDKMDDAMFGNVPALHRGIVFRFVSELGTFPKFNGFNAKTNHDLKLISTTHEYSDRAPRGEFGFSTQKSFGGQSNLGVVIRLEDSDNDSLQIFIQDDLRKMKTFHISVQGSVVLD